MKKYTLIFILLSFAGLLTSRTGRCAGLVSDTTASLKVGDSVPDLTFSNVVNYKSTTLRLSDFKGQVIMLDFWATWCSSCLAAFPHEYELEQRLPGIFKVILVDCKPTGDTPEKVAKFLRERKGSYQFTSISNDTILRKFFPHPGGLPHFVWIKDNKVVAIPDPLVITEANIKAVFNGSSVAIAQNKYIPFDYSKEVFKNGNGGEASKPIYHSLLYGYKPGLEKYTLIILNDSNQASRIDLINRTRAQMICYTLPDADVIGDGRLILNVLRPADYSSDSTSEAWDEKNRFVYESTFSPRSRESALLGLKTDIERFFNIHFYLVSRDTDCLVISLVDAGKIPKGIRAHQESNFFDHRNEPIFFRNASLKSVAGELENYYKIPVVDESGVKYKISLNLPATLTDVNAVADSLHKQGLKLSREKRKIQYLLVEDNSRRTNPNQR